MLSWWLVIKYKIFVWFKIKKNCTRKVTHNEHNFIWLCKTKFSDSKQNLEFALGTQWHKRKKKNFEIFFSEILEIDDASR